MDKALLKQITEGLLIFNFLVNTNKTLAVSQSVQGLHARIDLLESYWVKVLNRHGDMDTPDSTSVRHVFIKNSQKEFE